ncbi:hypothetical protein BX659_1474 [Orenia metallireducens]|uniref:Uncharacterized protein n=1 Tax=Orenia metallireducens TaxID=1413210 RepID=A0A285IGU5_9FIRM|nr:hypothetical protein BX659_1474 [Orenia metallireducens]SNY47189.1 hypothetical protein SAMN06265827_1484 [Orenia metallireducens]
MLNKLINKLKDENSGASIDVLLLIVSLFIIVTTVVM